MPKKRHAVQSKSSAKRKRSVQRNRLKKKSAFKLKHLFAIGCVIYVCSVVYGAFKPLPGGVSKWFESSKTNDVKLLVDKTYEKENHMYYNHEIFNEQLKTIQEADDFIILDMFLFNDTYDGQKNLQN